MTPPDELEQLDALLEAAREELAEPAPDAPELQIELALVAGRARHRAARVRAKLAASALVLAAAAALVVWSQAMWREGTWSRGEQADGAIVSSSPSVAPPAPPVAPEAAPVRAHVVQGHEMIVTSHASYSVDATERGPRVILRRGAILFDVEPLGAGERFVVETASGVVHVVGTVFAVEVGDRGTAVEVFEGRVRIETPDGEAVELGASESWGDGGEGLASLEERGRSAAAARAGVEAPRASLARASERAEAPRPEIDRGSERAAVDRAREWIVRGDAERALALAEPRAARDVRWRVVAADALRALGRAGEAADAYDAAAARSDRVAALQYGLLAGQIRLRQLDDASGALRSLEAVDITAADSPLRERGLALEAEAHYALGHRALFEDRARHYLSDYPRGSRRAWLERRLGEAAEDGPPPSP